MKFHTVKYHADYVISPKWMIMEYAMNVNIVNLNEEQVSMILFT